MSEYQYVAFRAIDGPVSDKNLEFMRRQSTRAEITPWEFTNEYHFGDFHGDAAEMLRRGYDFHLHYANFGTRRLMIRLPQGLPDAGTAALYFEEDSLYFLKDKRGPGGILCIEPFFEAGKLEEEWDVEEMVERLLALRAELLDGDLRPLYLAHLAVASDSNHDPDEEKEGPVPAGLDKLTAAQRALTDFYCQGDALLVAAARNSPPLPGRAGSANPYTAWLQRQPETSKVAWLAAWLADARSPVRREILTAYQKDQSAPSWPTVPSDRTVAELQAAAEEIQNQKSRRDAMGTARRRTK
jgi:hypothetical protein